MMSALPSCLDGHTSHLIVDAGPMALKVLVLCYFVLLLKLHLYTSGMAFWATGGLVKPISASLAFAPIYLKNSVM